MTQIAEAWNALATVHTDWSDASVRHRISGAFETLGLPDLAAMMHGKEANSESSLISHEELIANAQRNASASKNPLLLNSLEQWVERLHTENWHRTTDGNIVRLHKGNQPLDRSDFIRCADEAGYVSAFDTSFERMAFGGPPLPFYVEGLCPSFAFERLLESRAEQGELGGISRICVLQRDPQECLDGLARIDFTDLLAQVDHLWFVGESAAEDLETFIRSEPRVVARGQSLRLPETRSLLARSAEDVCRVFSGWQSNEIRRAQRSVKAKDHERETAYWARRFEEAREGTGPALRVLIPTCRYSTYVGASAESLADSFERAGCEVHLLIEPSDSTLLHPLAMHKALDEFDPDLVVSINHSRDALASGAVGNRPFVCWLQDEFPTTLMTRQGHKNALDFYVGHRFPHREELGFPLDRYLACHVLPEENCFWDHSLRDDEPFDREIAWATNHGEPPEDMLKRQLDSGIVPADIAGSVHASLDELWQAASQPMQEPLKATVNRVAQTIARKCGGPIETTTYAIERQVVAPLMDRVVRHTVAAWLASIAQRRGWKFELFGRGWEEHPVLGAHAGGVIEYGPDLARIYGRSAVSIHASLAWPIHQRVLECALAGGLPAVLIKEDDLDEMQEIGIWMASRTVHPYATPVTTRLTSAIAIDSPDLCALTAQMQRIGAMRGASPRLLGEIAWFQWFPGLPDVASVTTPDQDVSLLGDMSEIGFVSEATLERVIERSIEKRQWRRKSSEGIAQRTRRGYTIDALAKRLIGFVRDGVRRSAATDQIEAAPFNDASLRMQGDIAR
ncbi:MAG: hypothetical protein AAGB34_04055 [Planctomycetota bacterium]